MWSHPLGKKEIQILHDKIVICSILRAGLSLHQGIQNYLDQAENAFISAYRHHTNDSNDFEIIVEYLAGPSIEDKILLLADPMLASGQSFVAVKKALSSLGNQKKFTFCLSLLLLKVLNLFQSIFLKTPIYGLLP